MELATSVSLRRNTTTYCDFSHSREILFKYGKVVSLKVNSVASVDNSHSEEPPQYKASLVSLRSYTRFYTSNYKTAI